MRCRLILAVAGLLAAVGFAQAQEFAPKPIAPISIHAAAALPAEITQASARSTQGCSTCGTGPVVAYGDGCAAPGAHHARKRSYASKLFIGAGTINPVTCGCLASERTFAFGSCKQFYNPQLECGAGGCWHVDRRTPCQGVTSYLNR